MAEEEFQSKWEKPGWRIEQSYSPGVLIGNWAEGRYQFQRGNYKHNSTHRTDFQHYGSYKPDVIIRRNAQLANDGMGRNFLFCHHGNRYSNNMIAWYDEHYNGRERDEANKLPDLRSWDSHRLAWVPEKSDYPIQGEPTNFGLLGKLQAKWGQQVADETHGDYNTSYRASYSAHPRDAHVSVRYATPRAQSTQLHRFNMVNKNLNLRNGAMLQSPENLPCLPPTLSAPPSRSVAVTTS